MRLIDADALRQSIESKIYWGQSNNVACLEAIDDAPTVDAVEVVRCKDCKHYKPQNQGAHRKCTTPYCMRTAAFKVSQYDFCSYGERRTDNA